MYKMASGQQQALEADPISKFKVLVPRLKESLAVSMPKFV